MTKCLQHPRHINERRRSCTRRIYAGNKLPTGGNELRSQITVEFGGGAIVTPRRRQRVNVCQQPCHPRRQAQIASCGLAAQTPAAVRTALGEKKVACCRQRRQIQLWR